MQKEVSRCHLGSETALIYKGLFGLEILSKSKYEPLKNIRVLSQGITPLCNPLLHFACPDSFRGWGKLSIFLCSASKIIKGGTNPHPIILHTHSLHFPHLSWSSPPSLHAIQKKNLLLGDFGLQRIISCCFLEKYVLFPATASSSPQVTGME